MRTTIETQAYRDLSLHRRAEREEESSPQRLVFVRCGAEVIITYVLNKSYAFEMHAPHCRGIYW
jgi:hypothetical protein